jgi:thioredoxin-related protein
MRTLKMTIMVAVMLLGAVQVFASGDQWLTSMKEAQKIAKEKNLLILADFSGSDWCGWCIKLDKEVFSQKTFLDYAKDNFVLLMIDFPKSKKIDAATKLQNQQLAQKYQIKGFPTVLILDADGKVIKQTGYVAGGAEAYIKHLKQIKAGLKKK